MTSMHLIAATTVQTSVGYVLLFLVAVAVVVYGLANFRSGKSEVGSEVVLAPNRKPYYNDQDMETKRLDRMLTMAFVTLAAISVILPLYWLNEPSRQANAVRGYDRKFVDSGKAMFGNNDPVANPEGLGCALCHGANGAGGMALKYTLTDADGRFLRQVDWQAPALNTVSLRYNRAQIRYVLVYGRPFSPMPAWGVLGGGSLDDQQIEELVSYLESIQISPKASQAQVVQGLALEKAAAIKAGHPYKSDGEALFNLGYYSDFAGGAYSCGRCHTQGWSYGDKTNDGSGAFGPNLSAVTQQFPGAVLGVNQQIDFVCQGSEQGKQYGVHGQGSGRMPAFCQKPAYNPDTDPAASQPNVPKTDQGDPGSGMMTRDQVRQIVAYERGLG
jgi:cytochrome c553